VWNKRSQGRHTNNVILQQLAGFSKQAKKAPPIRAKNSKKANRYPPKRYKKGNERESGKLQQKCAQRGGGLVWAKKKILLESWGVANSKQKAFRR
jgi:hypothetical protein